MSEPKLCPFCGEMPELFTNPCYYYQCVKSGCEGQEVSWNDTEEEALKSWNARPIEDALRAEIAELKKDKPILCAECNDHILPDDEAICGVCADTKESIITELMAENEALKAQAIVWNSNLPEYEGWYLAVIASGSFSSKIDTVRFVNNNWYRADGTWYPQIEILYWAHLPEMPKEEK